jgi:hypothetical protein
MKVDTSKTQPTLEQRISAILATDNVSSDAIGTLLIEVETEVSESTKKVELERAISVSSDMSAADAHRMITQNELVRSRLRSSLPALQHKYAAAEARQFAEQWEADYLRVEKIRDDAAEQYAEIPKLMDRIIELFRLAESVDKQCSTVNGTAPANEHRRLIDVELHARGLQGYSQSDPSIAKVTQLPALPRTDISAWPPRPTSFASVFAPGPMDVNTTADWGVAQAARRRANDARVDQEMAQLEQQRAEFYRGR